MPISVFCRLTLGYMVILLMSVAVSSYSIIQLGKLSDAAHTVMNTDNRMIAYQETLTDAFLSEVRYAGRFLITRAGALHDELRQFKNDFARYMTDIQSLTTSADLKARLSRIDELHSRYHALFDQEVRYIKNNQPYAESRYQQEKDRVLESALGELERLRAQLQKNQHDKLQSIETAARTARTVAILTTLFLIGLGMVLSFFIGNSITGPLSELRRRTIEGVGDDSAFSRGFSQIPEIRDLADALSGAKRRLDEIDKGQAAFINSITEEFETPLIALRNRLRYVIEELAATATAKQMASLKTLADETERLIQHCAALHPGSADRVESKSIRTTTIPRKPAKESVPWRHEDLILYSNRVLAQVKCAMRLSAEYGSGLMGASWNAIFHSKISEHGKAKKQ